MPRSSGGTCTKAQGNVVAGTDILATWANSMFDDVITMLSDSLSRSGYGGMQANLNMGTAYKVVNLANGSASTDAVNYGQLTSGLATKASSGANTDITSLASPALADATANTQTAGDNTTKVATTAFVTSAVSPKANDSAVVHNTGAETIAGAKTFSTNPAAQNLPVAMVAFNSAGAVQYGFNVSSVTKNATGDFTINFTSAVRSANLIISGCANRSTSTNAIAVMFPQTTANSTTSCRIETNYTPNGAATDPGLCTVTIWAM